ncbi:hypothetical protein C1H46_008966 [Malus baccata]|uniref:Uncharacterized protein n=1 Tax=Malus baccata TaxID=106549 RepID=A0A540N2U8_MALBA|nr:hypothetical protein C1H46_008966 [Malus baccata]
MENIDMENYPSQTVEVQFCSYFLLMTAITFLWEDFRCNFALDWGLGVAYRKTLLK